MLTRSVGVINLSQFLQPPPPYSILIRYYSIIYHDSESGSRQMRAKETINTFAGIRKNCAMVACPPGLLLGPPTGGYLDSNRRPAPPTFTTTTAGPLCVIASAPQRLTCHLDDSILTINFACFIIP